MKPYKGIIRLSCTKKGACSRGLTVSNVQPECMDCENALSEVLDLDGISLFSCRLFKPVKKAGKQEKE